jgi:hypothetical protein
LDGFFQEARNIVEEFPSCRYFDALVLDALPKRSRHLNAGNNCQPTARESPLLAGQVDCDVRRRRVQKSSMTSWLHHFAIRQSETILAMSGNAKRPSSFGKQRALIEADRQLSIKSKAEWNWCLATLAHNYEQRRKPPDLF